MKIENKQPLQASVLDRLIDDNPDEPDPPSRRRGAINLRHLRQNVRRDLENLLNSKVQWTVWSESFRELDNSLVNYGLPDFSSMAVDSVEGREKLCRIVEEAIRRFEPRFVDVDVTQLNQDEPTDRILRLRIHALLHAEPEPEPITFDSEVEPVHLGVTVRSSVA